MITEEALDAIVQSFEEKQVDMGRFYRQMSDDYPIAVGWLASEEGPLTHEEQDYKLYLGMVILTLMSDNNIEDPDPESLQGYEEQLWDKLGLKLEAAIENEAAEVDDNDAVGVFLVDALSTDEELPFLTPPGAIMAYARLHSLAKVVGLLEIRG